MVLWGHGMVALSRAQARPGQPTEWEGRPADATCPLVASPTRVQPGNKQTLGQGKVLRDCSYLPWEMAGGRKSISGLSLHRAALSCVILRLVSKG